MKKCPLLAEKFSHIHRGWDSTMSADYARISTGQYYVTDQREMLTTVLGSCISVCIKDLKSNLSGMNHFMVPLSNKSDYKGIDKSANSTATRYGNWAMEYLINEFISRGCSKDNLEIKIFGGGTISESSMKSISIGDKNIQFVFDYLRVEKMKVKSFDVGGTLTRKVAFFSDSGEVLIKKIKSDDTVHSVINKEQSYYNALQKDNKDEQDDIELFN